MNTRISVVLALVGLLTVCSGCLILPEETGEPITMALTANAKTVLQAYKPALAVRGINCMMCHAQVHSSIITDFGYGDERFFVNSRPGSLYGESSGTTNSKPLTLPWYGNYYGTFQLADRVNGTLVVPKVMISDPAFLRSIPSWSGPSITLAELMTLDLGAGYYGSPANSGRGAITDVITPSGNNPKVAEIDEIYIGAPTAAEILGLSQNPADQSPGWEAIGPESVISGLVLQAGTGGSYVTHSGGTITCQGDVVIKGTLFLNDVTLDTGGKSCRLMVTQSVFQQGRIQFTGGTSQENLQISSARAILMGFSVATLARRLGAWYPNAHALTRGAGTNSQKNGAILAEANIIGSALHDSTDAAHCPTSMLTYEAYNGGSHTTLTQCSIHYQRLLLNAPNVQSRYVGRFSGVTIAEIALFAPGALDFEYDPVFDSVPILPLIAPVLDGVCKDPIACGGGWLGV